VRGCDGFCTTICKAFCCAESAAECLRVFLERFRMFDLLERWSKGCSKNGFSRCVPALCFRIFSAALQLCYRVWSTCGADCGVCVTAVYIPLACISVRTFRATPSGKRKWRILSCTSERECATHGACVRLPSAVRSLCGLTDSRGGAYSRRRMELYHAGELP